MTQLVLNISDPSVLPTLKRVVKAFKGVTIDSPAKGKKKTKCGLDKAIEDVAAGRIREVKSTDDLFKHILDM